MAQPVWITEPGSLGTIQEGLFFQLTLQAYDPDNPDDPDVIYYQMLAGSLPAGVQCRRNGMIEGTPKAVSSLQGVPLDVSENVTSTFAVRVFTEKYVDGIEVIDRLSDRTFSLTVTGQDIPEFITPAGEIATVYDGSKFSFQIEYEDKDPGEIIEITLDSGSLPPGLSIDSSGLIARFIKPVNDLDPGALAGYDLSAKDFYPWDFNTRSISKNYEFTLGVSDGKDSNIRTFSIFVYSKNSLTGDNNDISGDNGFVSADVVITRTPFLLTDAGDLGRIRHDNWFAYKFDGIDLDGDAIEYVISLGAGVGFDPSSFTGKRVDLPCTGVYNGTILTVQDVDIDGVLVFPENFLELFVGMEVRGPGIPLDTEIVDISASTITLNKNLLRNINNRYIVFAGNQAGTTVVDGSFDKDGEVFDQTGFQLPPGLNLDANTGWLIGYIPDQGTTEIEYRFAIRVRKRDYPTVISAYYFFTILIVGDVEINIEWITDRDLGIINNGEISTLKIEARSNAGYELEYRLKKGNYPLGGSVYNHLPQGLNLLETGEIVGRVSFNTFSLDGGAVTFDTDSVTRLTGNHTTFDLGSRFTVNAYNDDTVTDLQSISALEIISGGRDYLVTPTVTFTPEPSGSGAIPARAGQIIIEDGVVTELSIIAAGTGYQDGLTGVFIVPDGNIISAATATVRVNDSGQIANLTLIDRGSGYTNAPAVVITGSGSGANIAASVNDGVITNIGLGNPGDWYITAPDVNILNFSADIPAKGTAGTGNLVLYSAAGIPATYPGVVANLTVLGNGISSGTTVTSVTGATVTLSANLIADVDETINFSDSSGTGASANAVMIVTGTLGGISVFKEFVLEVNREYDSPYESLYIKALPSVDDRVFLDAFLSNVSAIPAEDLYRSEDPNFGKASSVIYTHAYGLNSSAIVDYVEAMGLNHYLKSAVLGEIKTARALNDSGNVLYEVVYSEVIDNLVNPAGESVSRRVPLRYPALVDGQQIYDVYPNSFDNMRNQIIDNIGQLTPALPAWMISKQENGRILGFVRAWVIAYVNPGKGGRIAYNLRESYPEGLNRIDFAIDRYELDKRYSRLWQPTIDVPGDTVDQITVDVSSTVIFTDTTPVTGNWIPSLGQTTFDRVAGQETIFDSNSIIFVAPVDTYIDGDEYDKYLVFPKRTILG